MHRARILLLVLTAFTMPLGHAVTASSGSYKLFNGSFSSSGGTATSPSFRLTDCLSPEIAASGTSKSTSYVLQSACAAAVTAFLPLDDDDGDGVVAVIEDAVANDGDGNGDGVRDRVQGQVVSLPSARGDTYRTLEICGDAQCSSVCQATGVSTLQEEDLPQQSPGYDFPYGLLGFTVDCSPADVRVLFHGEGEIPVYLRYVNFASSDTQGRFYELSEAVVGSDSIPQAGEVGVAEFRLEDGLQGDDSGLDGRILSLGGLALYTGIPVPALGLAGLLTTIVLMMLMAAIARRRMARIRR